MFWILLYQKCLRKCEKKRILVKHYCCLLLTENLLLCVIFIFFSCCWLDELCAGKNAFDESVYMARHMRTLVWKLMVVYIVPDRCIWMAVRYRRSYELQAPRHASIIFFPNSHAMRKMNISTNRVLWMWDSNGNMLLTLTIPNRQLISNIFPQQAGWSETTVIK